MKYEEVISELNSLPFLSSYDINYGKEYSFSLTGTFSIRVLKTFLCEGYAVSYVISHYGGDFSFEEFYDRMPLKMQENVIFNINTFHKINANQCGEEDRQAIIDWAEIMTQEYQVEFEKYGFE